MISLVIIIIIAFIAGFVYVKKKQTQIQDVNAVVSEQTKNYKALEKSLCSNFFLTMFHIV